MKAQITLMLFCSLLSSGNTLAQPQRFVPYQPPQPTPDEIAKGKLQLLRISYAPAEPWRLVDGQTCYAKGTNWVQFVGEIREVQPGKGIRVRGWYGPPMTWPPSKGTVTYSEPDKASGSTIVVPLVFDDFFVANFPLRHVEGDWITWEMKYSAREAGFYTYSTVGGTRRTLRNLDYGEISAPPQPRELTTQERLNLEQKKARERAATAAALLKHHEQLAEKGDAYGLFRMGERYLKGDGVSQDAEKGRQLLERAQRGGSLEAESLLKRLPN